MMSDNISPTELFALLLGAASAFLLIAQTIEKIYQIHKASKAPDDEQDKRIESLEERMERVENKLEKDKTRIDGIDDGEGVIQRALLALLDHALVGKNIEQMESSKKELTAHLTHKK